MEKVVRKISLKDKRNYDLEYWLSKTVEERIAAIEFLRQQFYEVKDGSPPRFQRVVRVIKREPR